MCIHIANAARLAMEALAKALKPSPPVDYLQWARDNIVFSERETPFPGPFNETLFPHVAEILRALAPDDPCRIITVMASAQVGKTVLGNIFIGGSMAMDPCDFLVTHPTDDNASRWSKLKLVPMLRGMPVLAALFPERSRDGANSVLLKEHRDGLGAILISGANSPASLSQVSMRRQVQDDLAKWEMNTAGDPEAQADSRSRAYEFAKIAKLGTPLVMPGCRITRSFDAGSQEYPHVPCPHCGTFQVLEWDNMLAATDPAKPEAACFSCLSCGALIEENDRPRMLPRLEWRARNPAARREHRSFWIWSAYSYLQSWERIYREWLKAKGDPAAEKVFLNDTVGTAYRASGEARPWEELRDRAAQSSYVRGTVPAGALLLMMGMDCQADRVEWQLVGFGRDYRRFVIDYGIVANHVSDPDCQRNLDLVMARKWRNCAGRELGIDFAAIDGNAWTEDVWSFARRHPASKLIMIRGRGEDSAPRLARVKRERNEKTGKLLKYSKRFYHLGVSVLKMGLYRDLAKDDPLAPGYVAFPSGLDDDYFQELTAERRAAVKRNGFTVFRWVKDDRQDNEALDTLIQATGAAIKHGVYGLSDLGWGRIESERETPPADRQGDLEDLLAAPKPPPPAADPKAAKKPSMIDRLA